MPTITHVLLVGVSTRAAAESAARAGFEVTAIDAFADRDQHPSVRALSCQRDFREACSARALARAARTCSSQAVAYLSPLENDRRAVSMITRSRALWGNPPNVLARVRNPVALREALSDAGVSVPEVALQVEDLPSTRATRWLLKPFHSGGGTGVREWAGSRRLPRGTYLQESVEGTVGSLVFVAAGNRVVPLGMSRQLIGDPAFGSSGFRYCGTILGAQGDRQFADDAALFPRACYAAGVAAARFGLTGVNGIDFVSREGRPHVIEVNPRWSSSMEVVERAYGFSVFGLHAAACTGQPMRPFDLPSARRAPGAHGRAIVYARQDAIVGNTDAWLAEPEVRDVPRAGEHIDAGRPICSVLATAADGPSCYGALVARAARVYAEVAGWERFTRAAAVRAAAPR